MSLILLGINHKTAPIELRERVAIPRELLAGTGLGFLGVPGVSEAMVLSTCNRVEVLAAAEAGADVAGYLERHLALDPALLRPHLYEYRDREAVRHLFRVAASLDSMVVGESQILGQVKDAYALAREAGTVASQLEPLLQSAFAAAKKVRSETEIGSTTVSIASVAVDLAQKIFGSLNGKAVFLVGAGKMSELAGRHLVRQGVGTILVANRTEERAVQMAGRFAASGSVTPRVVPWGEMRTVAAAADIVITSTGAAEPIFRKEDGQAFLHKRKNKPMFFIDIAVPRDVDPEMNRLEGIFLYDIDDLQSVAASHLAERTREASDAEAMIAAEVDRYDRKLRAVNVAPAIVALQQRAEELRIAELRRARLSGLTAEQFAAVEAMSRGLMNKMLHPAMHALKVAARDGDVARIEAIRETYGLASEPEPDNLDVVERV
jgi:glutamyl-tRNA reductase